MPILYHYCSTEALVSIVNSRSIRLSSLTLSNDSQEGARILHLLLQLAKESGLDTYSLSRLETQLRWAYDVFDGQGFCLSENRDLLSQWRGYADDGRGLCIGFNSSYFEKLGAHLTKKGEKSFSLKKIVYDIDGQRAIANKHFKQIKQLLDQGAFRPLQGTLLTPTTEDDQSEIRKATQSGVFAIMNAMLKMFDVKNPAFSEEQEWRLVSFSVKQDDDSDLKFRASGDKIIPYFEVKLDDLGVQPISAIVLGPKHQTPRHVIERMLADAGFEAVNISNSSATYR